MTRQMMKTFRFTPATTRGRLFDPGDPFCPFHGLPASRPAVDAALRLLAPAFDAAVDIGLAAGRWHEPVWACSRRCGVRLLILARCRQRRSVFARACGSLVSTDWADGRGAAPPWHPRWKLPWVRLDPARVGVAGAVDRLRAAMRAKGVPLVPFRAADGRPFVALPPLVIYADDVGIPGEAVGVRWATGCGRVDLRAVALIAGTAPGVRLPSPATRGAWTVLDLDEGDSATAVGLVAGGPQ